MSTVVIAVDPGLRHCGLAAFVNGKLVDARLIDGAVDTSMRDTEAWRAMSAAIRQHVDNWASEDPILVIEIPQIYAEHSKSKGPAEDLLQVACVVATLTAHSKWDHVIYRPHEWKGNKRKAAMWRVAEFNLVNAECAAIELPAKSLQHNVHDAISLGLWYLNKKKLRKLIIPKFDPFEFDPDE